MAHGVIEVTKHRPCPICGKTDWCGIWSEGPGREIVICKRTTDTSDAVGLDGKIYKFLGVTKEEQNARFQEMEQHEEWLRENKLGKYREDREHKSYDRWYGATGKSPRSDVQVTVMSAQPRKYEIVDPIEPLSHKELDCFYHALLSVLVLDPMHYDYLKGEGWKDALIRSSLVKSFPAKDFVRFNHEMYKSENFYRKRIAKAVMQKMDVSDLRGYPGAYTDKGGNWTLNGPSGIALPVYDADGYIYGIRIRCDFMDIDRTMEEVDGVFSYEHNGIRYYHQPFKGFYHLENGVRVSDGCLYYDDNGREVEIKGKYRPMTSYAEDRREREDHFRLVNRFTNGCQAENGISVYFNPKVDSAHVAYFTEGEKKGIYANSILHCPVVTFPGVSSWRSLFSGEKNQRMIDKLKAYGVRVCVVAYDADKETNAAVLKQQGAVASELVKEGFQVGLANWPEKYGKGLDDMLFGGFLPGFDLVK